jgi:membrane protease YdiL (CAAX protease family)
LNAAAGIVLGYLYWRLGIESAVLAHFAADMVVQGIGPRLLA